MMKHALIALVSIAFGMTAVSAHAGGTGPAAVAADNGSYEVAGLMWRCPKSNPVADWGWIGNGCLKQRLAAKKKKSSASAAPGGFAVQQPAPPPPLLKKRLSH